MRDGLPAVLRDRLRLPLVGSPMFIVSNPELVIAQCTSGVVGAFPSLNARPQPELRVCWSGSPGRWPSTTPTTRTNRPRRGSQRRRRLQADDRDSTASDIVYTNLFTGVHGNYLRGSIEAAGLDPANLPESDPSAMNFGTGDSGGEAKAWRDIWGAGQGVGVVDAVRPTAAVVDRFAAENARARSRLEI